MDFHFIHFFCLSFLSLEMGIFHLFFFLNSEISWWSIHYNHSLTHFFWNYLVFPFHSVSSSMVPPQMHTQNLFVFARFTMRRNGLFRRKVPSELGAWSTLGWRSWHLEEIYESYFTLNITLWVKRKMIPSSEYYSITVWSWPPMIISPEFGV